MDMTLTELHARLETLAVFRALRGDAVVSALEACLAQPSPARYAAFAAALYDANGGDLGAHLQALCAACETVCTRYAAQGAPLPLHLKTALDTELETLQAVSALSSAALQSGFASSVPLPDYVSGGADIAASVYDQLQNLPRRGYGMFAAHHMFCLDDNGTLTPVRCPDPVQLSDLVDYERERRIVLENTRALLAGKPAGNVLLTGDAGTGKSSTIKAIANFLAPEGLRLVELRREQLQQLPNLLDALSDNPLRFILFLDDLSFTGDDAEFNALKAALEGGLSARCKNIAIYATSNRRHLVKERFSDREGDDVHCADTLQALRSLSDRFGLRVTFQKPDRSTYLHIVSALAEAGGLALPQQELHAVAERAALERGGRSARLARQVVEQLQAEK